MARMVKIAVIGHTPPVLDSEDFSVTTKQMIDFWDRQLAQVLPDRPDLIVIPECSDRPAGFGDDKQKLLSYYQVRGNRVRDYFRAQAERNSCNVVYSAIREADDGTLRNSSVVIDRRGEVAGIYNKNHPVVSETTDQRVLCGRKADIITCDFGRIACAICFDLNFEPLRNRYVELKPELIVFSSMYHGGLAQEYWAYTCRSYFVGAIAGPATPSEIRNPFGEVIASSTNYRNFTVKDVNLDYCLAHLDLNWTKLDELKSSYGAGVTIYDPGRVGSVLIQSNREDRSAREMAAEFDVLLLDDYLQQSLEFHRRVENIEP